MTSAAVAASVEPTERKDASGRRSAETRDADIALGDGAGRTLAAGIGDPRAPFEPLADREGAK